MSSAANVVDPRYPIGKFHHHEPQSPEQRLQWRERHIQTLAELPNNFRHAVEDLTDAQLDTPYRNGGWTVRQLIHHVPDSHMNAYVRFKMALTENDPAIKTYEEQLWAELADSRETPTEVSLVMLRALHTRWIVLLRNLSDEEFARRYVHPQMGPVSLEHAVALYSWHSLHHTAHVTELRKRMGW